jgi:hypothetical protein
MQLLNDPASAATGTFTTLQGNCVNGRLSAAALNGQLPGTDDLLMRFAACNAEPFFAAVNKVSGRGCHSTFI